MSSDGQLLSAVIPLTASPDRPLPNSLGRAAQAWLLASIRAVDPALATWLHEGTQGRRPYTVSVFTVDGQLILRVTSLHAALSALLHDYILPDLQTLTLGGIVFTASKMLTDHLWASQTNFEALAREAFESDSAAPIRFDFATPTAFHRGGLTIPLPIPALLFGSLIQAWNSASPVPLPVPLAEFIEAHVALSRHRIRTRQVVISAKERHVGFLGRADFTFAAINKSDLTPEQVQITMQSVQLLARFATFAGVGIRTTAGMGQVRKA